MFNIVAPSAHVVARVITAVLFVNALWGGALRDDTQNGSELVE